MKKFLLLSFALILLASCSNFLQIEKRQHLSGFYIHLNKPQFNTKYAAHKTINRKPQIAFTAIQPRQIKSEMHKWQITQSWEKVFIPIEPSSEVSHAVIAKQQTVSNAKNSNQENKITSNIHTTKSHQTSSETNNFAFYLFSGIFALLSLFAFKNKADQYKSLSYWAKNNPRKTQAFILFGRVALSSLGFLIGKLLHEMGIHLSETSSGILLGLSAIAFLFYPSKKGRINVVPSSFKNRKTYSFAIGLLSLGLFTTIGNRYHEVNPIQVGIQSIENTISHQTKKVIDTPTDSNKLHSDEDEKYGTNELIFNILLTILLVVLAIVLNVLFAILSCSIACQGQELLAYVVFAGGLIGIAFGMFYAMKAVWEPLNPSSEDK